MPINPEIALAGRPPQFENPLDSLAKITQIRGAQAQQALIPGQKQLQQQELQRGAISLKNAQAVQDAFASANQKNPDGTTSFNMDNLKTALSGTPGGLEALTHITAFEKGQADLFEAQGKLDLLHRNNGGSIGAAVEKVAETDPLAAGHLFLTMTANGIANKAIDPKAAAPFQQAIQQALQQDPTGQSAAPILKQITGTLKQNSPDQQKIQTEADTAAARKATAAAVTAKLPGELALQTPALQKAQAEATLATAKANLAKNPQAYASVVDSLSLPPDLANRAKSQVSFYIKNGQIDEANKALDKAVEDANAPGKAAAVAGAEIPSKVAAERALAPIRTAQAVATERATAPLKTQQAIATAKALREGDNPAVAGVPPAMMTQVQTAATKLDQDYVAAKTAADDIANLLTMARGGNVSAGANIPLAGVGAINAVNGIKRINQAEINQYGTAGSLIQKIQGKLEGWTEGKPIPDSVLNDMAAVHEMLAGGAYQKYASNLAALNQRSGAKYAPAFEAPKPLAAAAAGTGIQVGQVVKLKSGKTVKVTAVHPDGTFDGQ